MPEYDTNQPGTGRSDELLIAAGIAIVLVAVVAWGVTHPPTRSRVTTPPPTLEAIRTPIAESETPPAGGGTRVPTPTLGPTDVMVYTLDGREVCSGYPVGNLGYGLRCAAPAGAHLFRVVNSAGERALAVPYSEQMLVRVAP